MDEQNVAPEVVAAPEAAPETVTETAQPAAPETVTESTETAAPQEAA